MASRLNTKVYMPVQLLILSYAVLLYGVAMAAAALMNRYVPAGRSNIINYSEPLEALRGVAAVLVLGAHTSMYLDGGVFAPLASSFLGAIGVMIFFVLTGHLFWSQVLAGRFNLSTFFPKRIRRLAPAATVMVAFVMVSDWALAGFPVPDLSQLVPMVRNFAFGFGGTNDVFLPGAVLRMNVIWSLRWEWLFYLVLPIAALFRHPLALAAFCAGLIVVFFDPLSLLAGQETEAVFVLAFFFGAAFAWLDFSRYQIVDLLRRVFASSAFLLVWLALVGMFLFARPITIVAVRDPLLLAVGAGLFAHFWAVKPAPPKWMLYAAVQLLGRVSYSLYLWQLIICWYVIHALSAFFPVQTLLAYIVYAPVMTAAAAIVAVVSYAKIELPFLNSAHGGALNADGKAGTLSANGVASAVHPPGS